MKRKEVIKDKLIVLKCEADKIHATREPSVVNTNNKIREYVSTICNHTEEEIYVSFSDSSTEIGLNDANFKTAVTFYSPRPSGWRDKWELNYGSVGSIDKDSIYLDRLILKGLLAQEFKVNSKLFSIIQNGIDELNAIKKKIDGLGMNKLSGELEEIERKESNEISDKIINKIIKDGGLDIDNKCKIYIKETSNNKSLISRIEFLSVTDKTIKARYYIKDYWRSDNYHITYRGRKDHVLANCLMIAKSTNFLLKTKLDDFLVE